MKLNELCVFSDNSCRETKYILKIFSYNIVLGSLNNCTQILGQVSKTYLRVSEMQSVALRTVDMFSLSFALSMGVSKDLNFNRHILSQKNGALSNTRCQNLDFASTRHCCRMIPRKRHWALSFIFLDPRRPIATFTVPHTWTIIWITQIWSSPFHLIL